ncbi:MAG: gamma-glutamylcyclotransferase [Cyanobacteriota bacterium]|jgi:cation transport regulator ChaC|nr:gamma-glutamylcyclotransferase [Cyanobacteriota bacterium]
MWIFAYGSLIFRPGFSYIERRRAFVRGWSRRFWQGSPDHRGVPDAPGCVVTLLPDPNGHCGGCAFQIDPAQAGGILETIDTREQAGFTRQRLALLPAPGEQPFAQGITWVAGPDNPHFLGPLPEPAIAEIIATRTGPSGPNHDYALQLFHALRELDIVDGHVESIVRHLSQ